LNERGEKKMRMRKSKEKEIMAKEKGEVSAFNLTILFVLGKVTKKSTMVSLFMCVCAP
jgi:hypothetical protein